MGVSKPVAALIDLASFAMDMESERNCKGREEEVFSEETLALAAKAIAELEAEPKVRPGQVQMARVASGAVVRATGHRYEHLERACAAMEYNVAQDLVRLIRNLKQEATSERNKRRRGQHWG